MDEREWQHDAQAKRVLAIFAGENPWRDDFEIRARFGKGFNKKYFLSKNLDFSR